MTSRLYALPLLLLLASLGACEEKSQPLSAAPANDPSTVSTSPELLGRLAISAVDIREITETLRVPARIQVDEQRIARIGAAVTGRVTEIHAVPGQQVHRGDVLATLHSAELSASQLAYLKAQSQQQLQAKAVSRAKLLFDSDVISAAELQRRESELLQAQAEQQASHNQLKVLGMTDSDIKRMADARTVHSFSSITATLDGTVIERKVTPGQVVQPADALFTVADLSHVWLVAEIPEQQAALVKKGETAQAEIPALNGKLIGGQLIFVADIVNPERRTVTIRMDVDNSEHILKPEMLASMLIEGTPKTGIVVPAAAVIREDNRDYVFVQVQAQRFQLRSVSLGQESNGYITVKSGLKVDEHIVTDGAFHLNNERKRKELEG